MFESIVSNDQGYRNRPDCQNHKIEATLGSGINIRVRLLIFEKKLKEKK
jgi:hypothetical protein